MHLHSINTKVMTGYAAILLVFVVMAALLYDRSNQYEIYQCY